MSLSLRSKALLCGILPVLVCLSTLAWWNRREDEVRRHDLERETQVVAHQAASQMEQALRQHLITLQQLANFWESEEEITETEFYKLAAGTLRMTPLCLRIVAVDASMRVRWVYPPGPNRDLVGYDLKTHPDGHRTQLRAIQSKQVVLSPPLRLLDGVQGFIMAAPIFPKGEYLAAVVCSFRSADFFNSLLLPEVVGRYEEKVSDAGILVFAPKPDSPAESDFKFLNEEISLGGRTWRVQVRPRPEVIQARLHSGTVTYWILGSLLALAVGGAVGAGTYRAAGTFMRLRSQGTALQETRARLDGAVQQLLQAEKMTALGELVAGVAHEVNNPLASIMGYTQLALTRNPSPEIRRFLESACSETARAGKIVRNLLTFARKQPPEKRYLGLNGIIEKTLELRAYHFQTGQIEVEKDLDPRLPMTMLDFHQMQQVLINLLNNAEQALQEAGRGGRIRIQTRHLGDRIEARFADNGPGIPAEIQNRVFEPFFTTKKDGKGTGLGLSLCYGIVQEHGGTLRVESRVGQGATFILDLPVLRDDWQSIEVAPSAATQAPSNGLRVLVVDDEPSVQNVMVEVLSTMGHRIDTASDVPEAVRKIAESGHDLIITDMKMPHGTGRDVYRAAVERSPGLARRVIFTTGDGESADTRDLVRETGNEILPKPWSLQEMEAAIARALGN